MSRSRYRDKRSARWRRIVSTSRARWREDRDDERTGEVRVRIYSDKGYHRRRQHENDTWWARMTHLTRMRVQRKDEGPGVTNPYPSMG